MEAFVLHTENYFGGGGLQNGVYFVRDFPKGLKYEEQGQYHKEKIHGQNKEQNRKNVKPTHKEKVRSDILER